MAESEFFEIGKTQEEVGVEIGGMKERGLKMLFVYTKGYDDIASSGQFEEMFGIKPDDQVQVEYYNEAEHTFRLTHNRKAARSRLRDWYSSQFAGVALANT